MSNTPRTDEVAKKQFGSWSEHVGNFIVDHGRTLERELAAKEAALVAVHDICDRYNTERNSLNSEVRKLADGHKWLAEKRDEALRELAVMKAERDALLTPKAGQSKYEQAEYWRKQFFDAQAELDASDGESEKLTKERDELAALCAEMRTAFPKLVEISARVSQAEAAGDIKGSREEWNRFDDVIRTAISTEPPAALSAIQARETRLRDAINHSVGCFEAAEVEGLSGVLENSEDERLKDLIIRRLMYALPILTEALAAPTKETL